MGRCVGTTTARTDTSQTQNELCVRGLEQAPKANVLLLEPWRMLKHLFRRRVREYARISERKNSVAYSLQQTQQRQCARSLQVKGLLRRRTPQKIRGRHRGRIHQDHQYRQGQVERWLQCDNLSAGDGSPPSDSSSS